MFVSVLFVRGILDELNRQGFPLEDMETKLRLDRDQLDDMRNPIGIADFALIVSKAMVLSKNPALGLTMGFGAPDRFLQVLSHLAMSGATPLEAFEAFKRYSAMLVDGFTLNLSLGSSTAKMTFAFQPVPDADLMRFANDFTAANTLHVLRAFGETRAPHYVLLKHPAPSYVGLYEQLFRCPVYFEQQENAVVGDASALGVRQAHHDKATVLILRGAADELMAATQKQSMASRIQANLRVAQDLANVNPSRMARTYGVSARALRRRLADEGTTLSTLLDNARKEVVLAELARPGGSVKVAAELAGYSEPSALSRAFRRWTGTTPGRYRRNAGRADAPPVHRAG